MEKGNHLSIIAIILAVICICAKMYFDISYFINLNQFESVDDIGMSPKMVAKALRMIMIFLPPVTISLMISIIGTLRKNKLWKPSLVLNLISVIYLFTPVQILNILLM